MRESVIYQGILQQGIKRGIEQVALNMLQEGIEVQQVAKLTNLSLGHIENLKKSFSGDSQK